MDRIAIIGGTGALGHGLALRLSAAGFSVIIGSRDADKAMSLAATLKAAHPGAAVSGAGNAEAADAARLCFLTVPYAAHAATLSDIRAGVQGKILVDATVPLRPPKVGTVQLPEKGCAALEAADLLGPDVRVVSALQNVGAEKLAGGEEMDADVLVCGGAEAAEEVRAILTRIGLRNWHAGPLANSAAAEALTSVIIQINRKYKISQAGIRITGTPKTEGPAPARLTVAALGGLPRIEPGADLAGLIAEAAANANELFKNGDVLVVAQKVVSKAEGRQRRLGDVTPGAKAKELAAQTDKDARLCELILSESQEIVRAVPGLVIVRHRLGCVLANAGIDQSNVADGGGDDDTVLLWPEDPDASARVLREALEARAGRELAVIISDSLGRAWRLGTTGTAIGASGLLPLRDRRGETDLFGRTLQATLIGVADEIASAASLAIGEAAEGTPVALVSGARFTRDTEAGIGPLLRPLPEDLFR